VIERRIWSSRVGGGEDHVGGDAAGRVLGGRRPSVEDLEDRPLLDPGPRVDRLEIGVALTGFGIARRRRDRVDEAGLAARSSGRPASVEVVR
jgi:hypothetical protein